MSPKQNLGRSVLCVFLALQLAVPASSLAAAGTRDLQVEAITASREKAALWVLAIGVSEYADPRISLQYADHDAVQIAAIMKSQHGVLFREVKTKTLINDQATRGEILRAMSEFLGQASQEDVVLIFLAGHGLQDRQTATYYFLPHNAHAGNLLFEGLNMPSFDEAVKRLRTNVEKVVLWLDTCHAGAMTVASRGVNTGEDLAEALAEASGQYVLSASKAGEESLEDLSFSFEGEEEGHGAFTYSLLRGLRGSAADSSGVVWLSDLFGHVSREVPRLTNGRQHPYSQSQGTDLPLFVLAEGVSYTAGSFDAVTSSQAAGMVGVPMARKGGGGKGWLWFLALLALGGGGAYVGLGGGGGSGASTIPGPPAHP